MVLRVTRGKDDYFQWLGRGALVEKGHSLPRSARVLQTRLCPHSWPPRPQCQQPHLHPRCWNPPKSRSDSSDFTSGKPGHLHLTCDGILSAPGWPWTMAICTFICLSLLESRGHFLLNHRAHSRCMQIFAKGKEDKRRMRGNIPFWKLHHGEDLWNPGGPITPPLNLGDLWYQAVLLGNHKKGWKIS